jgi:hypothetical protein
MRIEERSFRGLEDLRSIRRLLRSVNSKAPNLEWRSFAHFDIWAQSRLVDEKAHE